MSILGKLSEDERNLIVSVPYKAGLWISYADDVDGELDDEKEMKALEACIQEIAKAHKDKPVVQEILKETLGKKQEWERWADQAFHILGEAQKAVNILNSKISAEAAKNYRSSVIQIAAAVARAAGEFGAFDDEAKDEGFFAGVFGKIVGGLSSLSENDAGHPMNVSAAEDSALSDLLQALKVKE